MSVRIRTSSRSRATVGSRIIGTLFCGVFLAMGLLFFSVVLMDFWGRIKAQSWVETPCVILESTVVRNESGKDPFAFKVEYQYEYGGQTYTSERWAYSDKTFSDSAEAGELEMKYRVDSQGRCFVNPANPSEALLEKPSLLFGFILLFPLVFVLVGGGGMVGIWMNWKVRATGDTKAKSKSDGGNVGPWAMRAFFSVFLLFGLGFGYGMVFRPLQRAFAAQSWVETPCMVESSRVRTHRGDDSATYSIEVVYKYEFDGREFQSARYDFSVGSSSGRESKPKVVAQYPAGKKTVCYVNPRNPYEAVLKRGLPGNLWIGILPGIFVAVGLGGILFAGRMNSSRSKSSRSTAAWRRAQSGADVPAGLVERVEKTADGRVVLTSTASRATKLGCALIIALFWNGIVCAVGFSMFSDMGKSGFAIVPLLFLVPFFLIGLGLVGFAFYCFLGLFNPRPRLVVNSSEIPLGGVIDLSWEFEGRSERIRKLHVFLEGQEEARYRRGTDTATDRRVFATLTVAETDIPTEIRAGQGRLAIPENLMHSWEATNNKINWKLRMKGEIPRFPDVDEDFAITITPLANSRRHAPV